jgi:hypothetical protein
MRRRIYDLGLPCWTYLQFLEDRVYEILDEPKDDREAAIDRLCREHPEHATVIRGMHADASSLGAERERGR